MPFAIAEGLKIAYEARGAGEPVVFLHGVGSDRTVWADQLAAFSDRYQAIALDFRGHGESDVPAEITREGFARDVNAVLDALLLPKAHLVGLSMGGVAAMQFYLDFPARVLSLTLADTFAYYPAWHAGFEQRLAAIDAMDMRAIAEARAPVVLSPDAPSERLRFVVEAMARKDKRGYRASQEATWGGDFRDRLGRITVPTLVLVGEYDVPTPPAMAEALADGIPNARFVQLPHAGHISNLDNAPAFNAAVREFLAG